LGPETVGLIAGGDIGDRGGGIAPVDLTGDADAGGGPRGAPLGGPRGGPLDGRLITAAPRAGRYFDYRKANLRTKRQGPERM